MKKILLYLLLPCIVVLLECCKKSTTSTSASLGIPVDLDSLMPTAAAHLYFDGTHCAGVSGLMVALKVTGALTDTSGVINNYYRQWEIANFGNTGGTLTMNGANLHVRDSVMYAHSDTSSLWNETGTNTWGFSGTGTIPAFSAGIGGSYPEFTGTLPVTVSKSSDFTFTFNSGNTVNGDSAYVVIYYDLFYKKSNVVSANGGTAMLSSSFLTPARNTDISLSFYYGGLMAPIYHGGYIEFVIYNQNIQTFGGKKFAFIKQRQYLGIVQFL